MKRGELQIIIIFMTKIAVIGATGLVGNEILKVLDERKVPFSELYLIASDKSKGKEIIFQNKKYVLISLQEAIDLKPDFAIFSAGGAISLETAPKFAENGTVVIDNSSAWRMDNTKKLVVPEINGHLLKPDDKIIANPNCSTIQMVMALAPLHTRYKLKRLVISTYQSVSGTGKDAVNQLMNERVNHYKNTSDNLVEKVYPHQIDLNILPHIDVFLENDYTKEEMKMVNETRKILGDNTIGITATTVRVPVVGGHSESVNAEFENEFEIADIRKILSETEGIVLQDDIKNNIYPMPINAQGKDEVFVGRIRRDESQAKTLNMWIVADNLRKGAATNAVQIMEYLIRNK